MATDTLVRTFRCLPTTELAIVTELVTSYQASLFNISPVVIQLQFQAAHGVTFGTMRYNAFIYNYGITILDFFGTEFIRSDSPSIIALSNCMLYGDCDTPAAPCPLTNFYNRPVEE